MLINMLFLIILILSFIILFIVYGSRRTTKELKEQLEFICENESNKEITINSFNKEIIEISKTINKIIKRDKDNEIKLRKMQSSLKTTLVSISHDLRTPLTSISGYIQLLEKGDITEEKKLEYIKIINGRVDIVKNMLDLLFEFIRLENDDVSLSIEKVNVCDVLRDTIVMYYYDFVEKMGDKEPIIIIPEKDIIIDADKEALMRIFNNIIYNSLIHGDTSYRIELKEVFGKVEISFSNHTNSIEKNDVEMVFEKFFTADKSKSKKTTGLGLCISKLLVEKMNGYISSSMSGSIFEIKIKF